MEKFSDRTSTIFPLPSSPHWAPTMTAAFPFFKCKLLGTWMARLLPAAMQGRTHSLPASNQRVAELHRIYAEQRCTCNDNPGGQEMAIGRQAPNEASGFRHRLPGCPEA